MPDYAEKVLIQFQNKPFPHTLMKYRAKNQYATKESKAPPLDQTDTKFIQKVCGKFLF
jgi:hypothetical protein